MGTLVNTLNRIKAASCLDDLKSEYGYACGEHAGDNAALWAIAEATCAAKSRLSGAPVEPPKLDGDKGRTLPAHCYVERCIVANLIAHMARAGFIVHSVNDGEAISGMTGHDDIREAMEAVFAVDEASLRFWKPAPAEVRAATERGLNAQYNGGLKYCHGVLLICGNGVDIISDWNYTDGDTDGFNAAMEAFDAEKFQ